MCSRDVLGALHHLAVALASEDREHEVLSDHLASRAREVERERRHVAAEVVDVEDQVLRKRLRVAPDRPADPRVDESVLVARGVDRLDARKAEVPLEVGLDERRHEPARGRVDVERDVQTLVGLELVERAGDLLDRLVAAVERRAENRDDADRVLVALRHGLLGAEVVALALHRHQPRLDLPVAAELLPAHLDVGAHHQIRLVRRLAGFSHPLAPAPLQRHPGQHRRLARAGRRATGRLRFTAVPEPGDDVHAS